MSKGFGPTAKHPYLVKTCDGMYRHTQFTPEQTAIAQGMQQEGASHDEIAAHLHVSYGQVSYILSLTHMSHYILYDTLSCRGSGWVV